MPIKVIRANLADHPAVRAWRRLGGDRAEPDSIQILKEDLHDLRCDLDPLPPKGTGRSAVYRLVGVGPGGGAVVAKQGESAATEHIIYERILPLLPISALRYYGSVDDDDAEYCWLFLEDAGDERYSPEVKGHRALAGRWLGAMNASAQRLAAQEALPDRGAAFYLEGLRRARAMITKILGHPAIRADDRQTLKAIVCHCDSLETLWHPIEQFCERMPRTLVHGDLASKNVCVRAEETGQRLLVMDWETAGWGIPAADLAQFALESLSPDLDAYWAVVQLWWPNVDLPDLRRLAELGKAFRLIVALSWANEGFHALSAEWYMTRMSCYQPEMHDWLRTAGFQA
jgi:hypothetical protein